MTTDLATQLIDTTDLLRRLDAMTPVEAGQFYAKVQAVKAAFKEWSRIVDGGLIDFMTDHHTDIPIETAKGTKRLYVGSEKKTKCIDPKDTLRRLLAESMGDLDVVAGCLSSGAWKSATSREVLGDSYGSCFTEEVVKTIETGAPKRVIKTTQIEED